MPAIRDGMNRDEVFQKTEQRASDFEFDEEVAAVFDDMLARSVPFYAEQQHMAAAIAKQFWRPGTNVYDLGCSTATTLIEIAHALPVSARLIGYDNSVPMLERAMEKIAASELADRIEVRTADLDGSLSDLTLENASVVTMLLTLQFVRPLGRDRLVRHIYDGLVDGGALVVEEKVLTNSGHLNRFFIDFYYDFKRKQGYSDGEIVRKREALENVLIPYRLEENVELFRRNGFEVVETFFQWFNFAGFLCIKTPGRVPGV
jgi:tRNA (cmo5U34)-methyltransferase